MKDHEFVSWMADRMVHVYGESPDVDFVRRARDVAANFEQQAREIERLSNYIEQQDDAYSLLSLDAGRKIDELERELAALRAQPDPWQASGADWCSSIHRNPDAGAWADFFVAVFPGQAHKHDLMRSWFANAMMAMHDHLRAQQPGVVLPDELFDGHGVYSGLSNYAKMRTSPENVSDVLDRLAEMMRARLNSSPVSACGVDERAAEPHECTCPSMRSVGKPGLCPIHDASYIKNQQARAALTLCALTVPDGWVLVPVEPTAEILHAIDLLCDDHRSFDDSDAFWQYLLAAAPAPGKGGDSV